jgi:Flp pilus assembly protein TadD
MSASVSTATRLRYVAGYISLGLHTDAGAELDAIAPGDQDTLPVLGLRAHLCTETQDWSGAAALGATLCHRAPDDAGHWIQWAYAVRRHTGIHAAREILLTSLARHPREPILPFNLACYEAQLGDLPAARAHLRNACALLPDCREMALADSDLEPLHAWISAGLPPD